MNAIFGLSLKRLAMAVLLISVSCGAIARPYPLDEFADMVAERDARLGALITKNDIGVVHSPCVDEKTRECNCGPGKANKAGPYAYVHWFNNDPEYPAIRFLDGAAKKSVDPAYLKFFQQSALDPMAAICTATTFVGLYIGFYDTIQAKPNGLEIVDVFGYLSFTKAQGGWALNNAPEPLIYKSMTRAEIYNRASSHYAWLRKSDHDAFMRRSSGVTPHRNGANEGPNQGAGSIDDCNLVGMFCDLPAGDYFNAIYRGDIEMFFSVDDKYLERARARVIYGDTSRASALKLVLNNYMYEYGNASRKCLREDHIVKTLSDSNPDTYEVRTTIGPRGRMGVEHVPVRGTSYSSTVRINREFEAVCNMFCQASGFDQRLDSNLRTISSGLKKLMATHACDSPEIKQFERHLLKFFQKFYVEGRDKY